MPFYEDWTFWAVAVSIIAVILSQIPPILVLIKKAKIDFEVYSKVSLTHKVGNPNLQTHLLISNIGGRKVRIRNINIKIFKDGEYLITLPTQNYLPDPSEGKTVLFTTFPLMPNEDWSNIINLYKNFDREDEKHYHEIENAMKESYLEKREQEDNREELKSPIELDSSLTKQAKRFFDTHFIWSEGEYELEVAIETDTKSADISKKFKFIVFESQSNDLKEITEHYKYGGGFWWDVKSIPSEVIIAISESK